MNNFSILVVVTVIQICAVRRSKDRTAAMTTDYCTEDREREKTPQHWSLSKTAGRLDTQNCHTSLSLSESQFLPKTTKERY